MNTFRSHLAGLTMLAILVLGCGGASPSASIEQLETRLRELTQSPGIDPEEVKATMRELAAAYSAQAEARPEAPEAPEYLYKAAELYETNMLDPRAALAVFDQLIATYPEHERAADALFKKGYVYHNILNDLAKAQEAYLTFLETYPEHDLVASAKFEIENLGVPAEELLRRIQSADSSQTAGENAP